MKKITMVVTTTGHHLMIPKDKIVENVKFHGKPAWRFETIHNEDITIPLDNIEFIIRKQVESEGENETE